MNTEVNSTLSFAVRGLAEITSGTAALTAMRQAAEGSSAALRNQAWAASFFLRSATQMSEVLKGLIQDFVAVDDIVQRAKATLADTRGEVQDLVDRVKLFRGTEHGPRAVATAILELYKAGADAVTIGTDLKTTMNLMTESGLKLEEATIAVMTATQAWAGSTLRSDEVLNQLVVSADRSSLSLKGLLHQMTYAQGSAKAFNMSLAQTSALVEMVAPISGTQKAGTAVRAGISSLMGKQKLLGKLGIKSVDANGDPRNAERLLPEIVMALEGRKDKVDLVHKFFTARGKDVYTAMRTRMITGFTDEQGNYTRGAGVYSAMVKEVENPSKTLQGKADLIRQSLPSQFEQMKVRFSHAAMAFAEQMAGPMKILLGFFSTLAGALEKLMKIPILGDVIGLLAVIGPLVGAFKLLALTMSPLKTFISGVAGRVRATYDAGSMAHRFPAVFGGNPNAPRETFTNYAMRSAGSTNQFVPDSSGSIQGHALASASQSASSARSVTTRGRGAAFVQSAAPGPGSPSVPAPSSYSASPSAGASGGFYSPIAARRAARAEGINAILMNTPEQAARGVTTHHPMQAAKAYERGWYRPVLANNAIIDRTVTIPGSSIYGTGVPKTRFFDRVNEEFSSPVSFRSPSGHTSYRMAPAVEAHGAGNVPSQTPVIPSMSPSSPFANAYSRQGGPTGVHVGTGAMHGTQHPGALPKSALNPAQAIAPVAAAGSRLAGVFGGLASSVVGLVGNMGLMAGVTWGLSEILDWWRKREEARAQKIKNQEEVASGFDTVGRGMAQVLSSGKMEVTPDVGKAIAHQPLLGDMMLTGLARYKQLAAENDKTGANLPGGVILGKVLQEMSVSGATSATKILGAEGASGVHDILRKMLPGAMNAAGELTATGSAKQVPAFESAPAGAKKIFENDRVKQDTWSSLKFEESSGASFSTLMSDMKGVLDDFSKKPFVINIHSRDGKTNTEGGIWAKGQNDQINIVLPDW